MLYHLLFLLALQDPTVSQGLRDISHVAQLKHQHQQDIKPAEEKPRADPAFAELDAAIEKAFAEQAARESIVP